MIKIIGIGKIKDKSIQSLVEEYKKRISGYTKIEILEVKDEAIRSASLKEVQKILTKEGERALSLVKEKDYVILLDLHGKMMDSETLALKLDEIMTYQASDITFIIGGSLGVSDALKQRADLRWKLSDLTFTHQMTRVLVLEQIYRAYTINHHETYHK